MGAWDVEPWNNDEAADWFAEFFEGIDADARIEAALEFDEDNYDQVRAACYLLQVLGRIYVWPGDVQKLGAHLDKAIQLLKRMLEPQDPVHEELVELWGKESKVFDSIRRQLQELTARRSEGTWE